MAFRAGSGMGRRQLEGAGFTSTCYALDGSIMYRRHFPYKSPSFTFEKHNSCVMRAASQLGILDSGIGPGNPIPAAALKAMLLYCECLYILCEYLLPAVFTIKPASSCHVLKPLFAFANSDP